MYDKIAGKGDFDMNIDEMFNENEKPLDRLCEGPSFCSIFRTVACVGDSLSSGEFETKNPDGTTKYTDCYEYSWGQFLGRDIGSLVYNFSRGGMTAKWFYDSYAKEANCFDPEKPADCYIIAMGVNDVSSALTKEDPMKVLGTVDDIDADLKEEERTFAWYYSAIVKKYREISPTAKFFFMTQPHADGEGKRAELKDRHAELLYEMAEKLGNAYVLDFRKYAPVYDKAFKEKFYLHGHMNACGYALTAQMVKSYIDYIVRHNIGDFKFTGIKW